MSRDFFMRLKYAFFLACILIVLQGSITTKLYAQVTTGLDNLIAEHWTPLKGKNVGLITNQTGRTRTGEYGDSLFVRQKSFHLIALFAPEHGLMGERAAGVPSDMPERMMGIPVYSLYGSTRKPTKAMLHGINALVFDIQDIGVRPYTYLSTMILSMEAAAENHIPFFVLDRPNPLSGTRIEGNMLDSTLKSFVGQIPVPYIHGMTLGELATMAKAKGWFKKASDLKLTVIPMRGWKRTMYWNETGLAWNAPSPNIPNFENAVGAAMFGATGELGIISIGIGSDAPFLRIGSTLLGTSEILDIAHSTLSSELTYIPGDFIGSSNAGSKNYHGIRIVLPSRLSEVPSLYQGQYRMLEAMLRDTALRSSFDQIAYSSKYMFAKVTGMHGLADILKRCEDLTPVFERWKNDVDAFERKREPYLLYR
jgi:uncharacterized protein YbbC (DUF1343 family)